VEDAGLGLGLGVGLGLGLVEAWMSDKVTSGMVT
jgi:hypothetical protein